MNESNNFDAVDNIHSDSDSDYGNDSGNVNDHHQQDDVIDHHQPQEARVSEVRGRFDVGTLLIKHWEGLPYTGRITSNNG